MSFIEMLTERYNEMYQTKYKGETYNVTVQPNGHKYMSFVDGNDMVTVFISPQGRTQGGEINGANKPFPVMDKYQKLVNEVLEQLKLK